MLIGPEPGCAATAGLRESSSSCPSESFDWLILVVPTVAAVTLMMTMFDCAFDWRECGSFAAAGSFALFWPCRYLAAHKESVSAAAWLHSIKCNLY